MKLTLTLRLTSERFPDIGWRETAFIRGGHCDYTKNYTQSKEKKKIFTLNQSIYNCYLLMNIRVVIVCIYIYVCMWYFDIFFSQRCSHEWPKEKDARNKRKEKQPGHGYHPEQKKTKKVESRERQ